MSPARHWLSAVWIVLSLIAWSASLIAFSVLRKPIPKPASPSSPLSTPATFQSAPSVDSLQQLAELVSLRVRVSDILTVDQPGWFNGFKGAWIVKGDALWVTDLARAEIEEVSTTAGHRTIRVTLPKPTVTGARLDQTQTRTYDLRAKGWLPLFSIPESVRTEALERAQQIVEQTANQEEHRVEAQRQTETVLIHFYAAAGFRTEIVWQDADWNSTPTSSSPSSGTAISKPAGVR